MAGEMGDHASCVQGTEKAQAAPISAPITSTRWKPLWSEVLRKALAEPNLIHTFVETYVAERRKLSVDIAKQRNRAEPQLAKAKAALNRGIDALIAGRITNEEWANRRPELDARVSQAERELALCKTPAKVDLHPGALKKYRDAVDSLHDLLGKERRRARTPNRCLSGFGAFGDCSPDTERLASVHRDFWSTLSAYRRANM